MRNCCGPQTRDEQHNFPFFRALLIEASSRGVATFDFWISEISICPDLTSRKITDDMVHPAVYLDTIPRKAHLAPDAHAQHVDIRDHPIVNSYRVALLCRYELGTGWPIAVR